MRREIALPDTDVRALDALGLCWETVAGPVRHLIVHGFPLPTGYNVAEATALVRLDSYPPGPLDMVYFAPALARSDGRPIGALTPTSIGGSACQQWSRHYPWRQGQDSLSTHLGRIRAWLRAEFRKR